MATTYLLASYEMTQNLAYVAMTRHRYNVQVFGSSLDFWWPEKLPEVLSKSGEKLSAGDYLDADSLNKLMQQDDRLLTKIFERVSNELDAMGAVSKKAFWQVADHFLGVKREKDIRIDSDSIREEVRAEEVLQAKIKDPLPQDKTPSQVKETQPQSKTPSQAKGAQPQSKAPSHIKNRKPFIEASLVEAPLKQNMSSFADDIFSSIGEPYNVAASSSTERRYGKNGHIAVNLKTGAWIDHKDSDRSGGPLHMLTKLKGLGFKEAVEYGANWAGLSQTSIERAPLKPLVYSHQANTKQELDTERQEKIDKAQALWDKGRPLQGTLAERYLREHRKIEGFLSDDLRYLPFFTDMHSKSSFPCIMAGARSESGEITAVQITFLNAHTAAKADIPVAKRSFGVVKGSAVTLQKDKSSNILFVAEGVETALSLKSAGIQGTIKASLGLSNIKRMAPEAPQTHIVICADHDAPDSPAAKSLEKSIASLQERGLAVTVIKPDKLGDDFNDVLKSQGLQGVRDILARNLPKDFIKTIQTEKDFPSENPLVEKAFIERKIIEKSTITPSQKSEEKAPLKDSIRAPLKTKTVSIKDKNEEVFEELTQQYTQKLYAYLGEEKMSLTSDLKKQIESQSEKAANFIFYAHTLKGTRPTDKEVKNYLLRAKREFDRVSEIRQELVDKWQKAGKYKAGKDELIAHMIAERQASIEGRMYFEAKQKGMNPSSAISTMAARELKTNRALAETLAQELESKRHLSKDAAINCAKDILRFQETHGEKPSSEQMATMVTISRNLDKQGYSSSIVSHNVEYLRRRDGELMFREMSAQGKDLSGFKDFPYKEQMYGYDMEKSHKDTIHQPSQTRNAHSNEMELSL